MIYTYRFSTYENGKVSWKFGGLDFVWLIFKGEVHLFSISLLMFVLIANLWLTVVGIYSWVCSFTIILRITIIYYLYFKLSMLVDYIYVINYSQTTKDFNYYI